MYKLTILTEAGKNIGLGHYTRCSALRDYLIKSTNVNMIVYCNEIYLHDKNITTFNWLEHLNNIPNSNYNDCVLVDSYLAKTECYTQLKLYFKTVVAIDDYNRLSYDVHLLINPNVFFESINYTNQKAICIGGKDFVMLRESFRNTILKKVNPICTNLLVTLGGTDYRNLLPAIIDISADFPEMKWVIIDPEQKLKTCIPKNVLVKSTTDAFTMAQLMVDADLAISGCGQTLHELVALQTPAIGICIDHDQVLNQQYYHQTEYLLTKNAWNDQHLKNNLRQQIHELTINAFHRESIVNKCANMINKNGVKSIATLLISNQ